MSYWDDEMDDGSIKIKIDKVPGEVRLDEVCYMCSGYDHQNYRMKKPDPNCTFCDGKGFRLTETGQKVLDFLKKWQ